MAIRVTPLILQPMWVGMRNRIKRRKVTIETFLRDIVLVGFALLVMGGIYYGTSSMLAKLATYRTFAYLPAQQPIGLVLMLLLVSLTISNFATSLGTLFLSKDLDLLLSSPVSTLQFFFGKFVYVLLSTSWMPAIFILPFLAAFGFSYDAPLTYYISAIGLLLLYFSIPTCLGIIFTTLLTTFVPARLTRWLIALLMVAMIFGIYLILQAINVGPNTLRSASEMIRIVTVLSLPDASWVPSHWVAANLAGILEPSQNNASLELMLLGLTVLSLISFAYMTVYLMHAVGYSRSGSTQASIAPRLRKVMRRFSGRMPDSTSYWRAVISKEFRTLMRDVGQASQLLILAGIALIYIYNLRIFHAIETLPAQIKLNWQEFLYVANISMGAFVATAMCTRFVFPSISLEGRAYWLMQTAPINPLQLMQVKFWGWFFPVGILSSIVFVAGSLTIGANPTLAALNAVTAWVICYGITGLGIGLGAVFSRFDWEHPSELAASFGSLSFMLSSIVLILFSLIPAAIVIFFGTPKSLGLTLNSWEWLACYLGSGFLLVYINIVAKRIAFKYGERALLAKMN